MQYRQCIQTTSKYGDNNFYYLIGKIIANTKKQSQIQIFSEYLHSKLWSLGNWCTNKCSGPIPDLLTKPETLEMRLGN